MNCSEINFVQSQHFYGLAIARHNELPSLKASDKMWIRALSRLNQLANMSAKIQIEKNKEMDVIAFNTAVMRFKWTPAELLARKKLRKKLFGGKK